MSLEPELTKPEDQRRKRFVLAMEHGRRASAGLVWLARFRRFHTLTLGSPYLFVVVGFDPKGGAPEPDLTPFEVTAMRVVVHGPSAGIVDP